MIQSYNTFPIPLHLITVANWEEKKEKLLKLHLKGGGDNPEEHVPDRFTDYRDDPISSPTHDYKDEFLEIIQEEFSELKALLLRSSSKVGLDIDNVWTQKYVKSGYMEPHNHGQGGFSAVLYLEFDPAVHPATTFQAPFNDLVTGELLRVDFPVKEGQILVFPSSMTHWANPSYSDKERIIMSFNTYQKEL